MAIRLFLCPWDLYETHGLIGQGSYIRVYYPCRHIQMRINRKNCLIAIKDENVPDDLETDPEVKEVLWEANNVISTKIRTWILNQLDITVPNGMTYKTLFEKAVRRKDLGFDLAKMKKYLNTEKGSLHIDLLYREMDL